MRVIRCCPLVNHFLKGRQMRFDKAFRSRTRLRSFHLVKDLDQTRLVSYFVDRTKHLELVVGNYHIFGDEDIWLYEGIGQGSEQNCSSTY